MELQIKLFEYDRLEQSDRDFIQGRTNEIKALVKRTAQDIIDIGAMLIEVKERLPHGMFGGWLDSEFGWTQMTAINFMRVSAKFKNFLNLDEIAPSALYLLAAPSTPDEAREEAIARAAQGETITHKAAKEIVGNHRIVINLDDKQVSDMKRMDRDAPKVFEQVVTGEISITEAKRQAFETDSPKLTQPMQVLLSHKELEYYTPAEYMESTRVVMGSIDLDPASSEIANETINALTIFTQDDNGLKKDWTGNVWLNPPYSKTQGKSNQELWAKKLIDEYQKGNVDQAILLVKAALGYRWFEALFESWPVCLATKRLSFTKVDGTNDGQSKHGTAFFYFGNNLDRFVGEFSKWGCIIDQRKGNVYPRQQ